MEKSIVILGSINYDIVASADHLPVVGETVSGSGVNMYVGGKGSNQATQASLAGANTHFIGLIGDDNQGKNVRAGIQENKVNDHFLETSSEYPTGCCTIYIDPKGDNMLVHSPGANHHITEAQIDRAASIIKNADIFITQNEINVDIQAYAFKMAHDAGVTTILNPAPALPASDKNLYAMIDYITPNETESELSTGLLRTDMPFNEWCRASAEWFMRQGVKNVCITLGEKGAYFYNGKEELTVPAFTIKAVDTTAAGDAFNGGFAFGLAESWPIEKCLQFGNACGAMAAMTKGAQNSIRPYKEVVKFLNEHGIDF